MKIELWLINKQDPGEKRRLEADLPVIPRKGEVVILGDVPGYKVSDIVYRFDEAGRFTGRITVDAFSL